MAMMGIMTGSLLGVWSVVDSGLPASHHVLMMVPVVRHVAGLVVGLKVVGRPEAEICQT